MILIALKVAFGLLAIVVMSLALAILESICGSSRDFMDHE